MTVASQGTRVFWELYRDLPVEVRESARKAYRRWQQDAFHPSLHFKKVRHEKLVGAHRLELPGDGEIQRGWDVSLGVDW